MRGRRSIRIRTISGTERTSRDAVITVNTHVLVMLLAIAVLAAAAVAVLSAIDAMSKPKDSGLRCPSCRKGVAVIEATEQPVMVMRCSACGHRWQA